jgi:hypothetical protein
LLLPPALSPNFEAFTFAEESQDDRLEKSGFRPDPHLKRFTGISVEISAERFTGSIRKPPGINTIRSSKEVEAYNVRHKATQDNTT